MLKVMVLMRMLTATIGDGVAQGDGDIEKKMMILMAKMLGLMKRLWWCDTDDHDGQCRHVADDDEPYCGGGCGDGDIQDEMTATIEPQMICLSRRRSR